MSTDALAPEAAAPTVATRPAEPADMPAIKALNARVFGPGRFVRTAYRVREGTPDLSRWCRVAEAGGSLIASIRMTAITIGGAPGALLLGPLAVEASWSGMGFGRRLIAEVIDAARQDGRTLVLLVGDLAYYGRFGFVVVPPGRIALPGPVDPGRLLALPLAPDAVAGASGMVAAEA
jgi:predicted N-acetyltransferase YhbS